MKARYCLGLILAGLLTALNAVAATAAQPQPETSSAKAHVTKPAAKPAVSAKQASTQKKIVLGVQVQVSTQEREKAFARGQTGFKLAARHGPPAQAFGHCADACT